MTDRAVPVAGWAAHPYCYLTTTGRRSGRPHRIEIWFVVHDGSVWLLTERAPETDWVRNLRVDPHARLELGSWSGPVTATVADDLPADHPVRHALATRYGGREGEGEATGDADSNADGDGLDEWAAHALAVRLDLDLPRTLPA